MIPKAKAIKAKANKRNHIMLKIICLAKETVSKMNRQQTEWGKICANPVSGKGLIFKIYKEVIQHNRKTKKQD